MSCADDVAPRVGAWIETYLDLTSDQLSESHPVWVRGLKLSDLYRLFDFLLSHPVWVRGLKLRIERYRVR